MNNNPHIVFQIFKDISFSKEEIGIIASVFKKITVKKGDTIVNPGDFVDNIYYILDGCLRSYHIDIHGKEYTVQFGIKDWWITDYTAFFLESKAVTHIEILEDATLYSLSRKDREYLYKEIPQIDTYIRVKLERAYAAFQKRILANLSQSATERYLEFIQTHPDIEKKVKNYHIASYLGITTESLSRIRKNLNSN